MALNFTGVINSLFSESRNLGDGFNPDSQQKIIRDEGPEVKQVVMITNNILGTDNTNSFIDTNLTVNITTTGDSYLLFDFIGFGINGIADRGGAVTLKIDGIDEDPFGGSGGITQWFNHVAGQGQVNGFPYMKAVSDGIHNIKVRMKSVGNGDFTLWFGLLRITEVKR